MNVLILMAGKGSRFVGLNEEKPKPLVTLHSHALVEWVVKNLVLPTKQKFIFVCLNEHIKKYNLHALFLSWNISFEIVAVSHVTEGAACSALLASEIINNDEELIIANSDQYVFFNKDQFLEESRKFDGLIMTMNAQGTKWSYAKVADSGLVTEVKEKVAVSNFATVGLYYFKHGKYFVQAAQDMISANDRFNNEFYLAPAYNYMIKKSRNVSIFNVGQVDQEMIGLGTAEDFLKFRDNPISLKLSKELFK